MKPLLIILFAIATLNCRAQQRQWKLSNFGIYPSETHFVGKAVQHLIDSAQSSTDSTVIIFDRQGEYCFRDVKPGEDGVYRVKMDSSVSIQIFDWKRPIFHHYDWAAFGCIKAGAIGNCIGCCDRKPKKAF